MPETKPIYLDLEGYVLVRADYHASLVACVERAQLKLQQFKDGYWSEDSEKMKDRIRLLGFVLATEDAL